MSAFANWKFYLFFSQLDPSAYSPETMSYYPENFDGTDKFVAQYTYVIAKIERLAFFASGLAYAFFYHCSMRNAQILDPETAKVSPTGMWWWHVVPVASFWMPLLGVIQVWRTVRSRVGLSSNIPQAFSIWWGSYIGGIFAYAVIGSRGFGMQSLSYSALADQSLKIIPVRLVLILSSIALWWITDRIYRAQQNIVEMRASEEPQAEQAPPADTEAPAES